MTSMERVPNSASSLQKRRAMRSLSKEGVDVNVILAKATDQNDKEIGQLRVELPTFQSRNFIEGSINGPSHLVWPLMRKCIKHIGERCNARREWNTGARQISWISRSIPPLVMM